MGISTLLELDWIARRWVSFVLLNVTPRWPGYGTKKGSSGLMVL